MLFTLSLSLFTYGQATNQDFGRLKSSLKEFIATNGADPSRNVPLLVRLSFHDLSMIDGNNGMGPQGCLLQKPIQDIGENAGLAPIASELSAFVKQKFPNTPFSTGDVISLAGKVAVETAFPCVQIRWGYGRSDCKISRPGAIPPGNLTKIAQLKPFLNRYGLTSNEMAVLIAGAHGIKNAKATSQNSGFGTQIFAAVNSGQNWIDLTFKLPWLANSAGFFANDPFPLSPPIMRMPIDMLFFPTVAKKSSSFNNNNVGADDPEARPVEEFLKTFVGDGVDRSNFDQEFARVYSKMLQIGVTTKLTPFVESENTISRCT